ncbi:alpha/beta hydrolase family protein [Neptunicella sp.]|uniref:alpha/beta hydrolase family protein n=1 Tax=Neptunicella sp. TaxID=2125986 RepID=UPI003F68D332
MKLIKKLYLILTVWLTLTTIVCADVPDLEDFLREADYKQAVISPSGRYLAQLWNRDSDGARIVTISDLAKDGNPTIGKTSDRLVRPYAISWANDERLLLHVLVPYNTESVQEDMEEKDDFDIDDYYMFSRTLAIDVDAKNPVVLLDDDWRTRSNRNLSRIKHFLPDDPKHILMEAWRNKRRSLYKVNVYTGESEVLVVGGQRTFAFLSDDEGNPLYRLDYLPISKRIDVFELDQDNDWVNSRSIPLDNEDDEQQELQTADLLGLYGDKLVYRQRNEKSGYYELVTFNDEKDKHPQILASVPDKDILYPLTNRRSDTIVGYAVDGDNIRYKFFDSGLQSFYDKIALQVGEANFQFTSSSTDGLLSTVLISGADIPASYFLYHREKNELTFLRNGYSGINTTALSQLTTVNYMSRDGKPISAYLYYPRNYKDGLHYPLVLLPHGGPHARDRASYDDFAQFIATRGYLVLKPNFRGSTGFGKDFEEAGYKQWGQNMQNDLTDAVTDMVKSGLADPKRVCIVGISYGGYAALIGPVKTPELYACAISINGISDLNEMIEFDEDKLDSDKLIKRYVYDRVGDPVADAKMLRDNSPINFVAQIKTPMLIIASTKDEIVDFEQSENMADALEDLEKVHKFITLEDSGHNPFRYREDMRKVYSEVESFLASYLN